MKARNCGSGAGICCPPDPPRLGSGSAQRPWGLTARPRWNKWWRARRPVWSPGSGAGVAGRDNLAWHLLKYFLFFDLGFWRHFKLDYQVGFLIPHLNPAGGISAVKFDWGGDADTKKPVHQPAPNSPSEWEQIMGEMARLVEQGSHGFPVLLVHDLSKMAGNEWWVIQISCDHNSKRVNTHTHICMYIYIYTHISFICINIYMSKFGR